MLPTDNVIDLVREHGRVLRETTVLAGVVGTSADKLACLARQRHDAARIADKSSACSLSTLSVSFSQTITAYSPCSSGVRVPAELL